MSTINKVIIMGRLTRDPELKYTSSSKSICTFSVAMNKKYKNSAGEDKEEKCFVDVIVWGSVGEACSKYIKKGSNVFIEGKLNMESWDDKNTGAKRTKINVVAENVVFIDGAKGDDSKPSSQQQSNTHRYSNADKPTEHSIAKGNAYQPQRDVNNNQSEEDDIPF